MVKDILDKAVRRVRPMAEKIRTGYLKGIFKKDFVIGLDLGKTSFKIAQFAKRDGGLILVKAGFEELAPAKDRTSYEKEALGALRKLLSGVDLKKSKFIVTVNCPKTCMRTINAPYMPRQELAAGIKLDSKSYFPFSLEEAFFDFEILGEAVEKGVKKYRLLLAASPKETVANYLGLLSKAGIKPSSFIPVPLALGKVIAAAYPAEVKAVAALDIGEHFSELVIFLNGMPIFSRKIPLAGGDFTRAMTGVLASDRGKTGLHLGEAEEIKRELGIPAQKEDEIIKDRVSAAQVLSMLRAPLEQLAGEVDRCFDYYREEHQGEVGSLLICGGGAKLKGLGEFLSRELAVEVKEGGLLKGLKVKERVISGEGMAEFSLRLALAAGAALSEAKGINLLPPEVKGETRRTLKRTALEVFAAGAVLTAFFIYIGMKIQLGNYRKRIAASQMELSSMGPRLKKLQAQSLANKILEGEPYWEDIFRELSNLVPDGIYFTELAFKGKSVKIKGVVVSSDAEEALSKFILSLEEGIFKNVRLVTVKEASGKAVKNFELECRPE